MDATLGVAIINGVFSLLILVSGVFLNTKVKSVKTDVAITKNEVQNSHTKNFRDDLDDKFSVVNERFDAQDQKFSDIHASIDSLAASGRTTANAVSRLRRDFSKHTEDSAEELENVYRKLDEIEGSA